MMEINGANLLYNGSDIDSIKFDRMGAEVIYKLLLSLGSTKDATLQWDEESGKIHIMKKFRYTSGVTPLDGDDGVRTGTQYYSLSSYIKLLIRFDRSAYKRMKNVENKINSMNQAISKLDKQL